MVEIRDSFRDENILSGKWYATPERENIRIALHKKYCEFDYHDYIFEQIRITNSVSILDAGCGTGETLSRVTELNNGLNVGVDISSGLLRILRQIVNKNVFLISANVISLPFPDRFFDLTFCNYVLYHVKEVDKALSELRRVTKKGGMVVVITKSKYSKKEMDDNLAGFLESMEIHEPITKGEAYFCMEDAEGRLERHFSVVKSKAIINEMKINRVDEYVDYLLSTITFREIFERHKILNYKKKLLRYFRGKSLNITDISCVYLCSNL